MLEEAPHRRPTLTRRAACGAFVAKIDLPKSSRWRAAAVWPTMPSGRCASATARAPARGPAASIRACQQWLLSLGRIERVPS